MTDGDKLLLQSTGKVTIKAQEAIHIRGKKVVMSALTQIRLLVAGSEINLNNLHDHGADGKVWYIGTTSQVLEPVTQPRKTNTPRGPDFSDLAPHVLGTVTQFVQGFADATLDNLSMGLMSPKPIKWTTSYKVGRLIGDVAGVAEGIIGMTAGAGMTGGGSAVSVGSCGTLAIAGVPIAAEGVAVITASSALMVKSAAGFMADASHSVQDNSKKNQYSYTEKTKTGTERVIEKRKLTLWEKWKYRRPSHYRKGVRDKVWEKAKIEGEGEVKDPLTGEIIHSGDAWDMGHKPGYEFWKHMQSAADRGISRKQFLDEYNNPEHYRPELPSSNRKHTLEIQDGKYYGD